MSHEDNLNPADRELEESLRSLSPASARIDPIAAAFSAGAQSGQHKMRVWQSIAAVMLFGLVGSWVIPMPNRSTTSPHVVVQVQSTDSAAIVPAIDSRSVLAMQEAVRDRGIGALPRAEIPVVRAFDAKDMF